MAQKFRPPELKAFLKSWHFSKAHSRILLSRSACHAKRLQQTRHVLSGCRTCMRANLRKSDAESCAPTPSSIPRLVGIQWKPNNDAMMDCVLFTGLVHLLSPKCASKGKLVFHVPAEKNKRTKQTLVVIYQKNIASCACQASKQEKRMAVPIPDKVKGYISRPAFKEARVT